LLAVRLAGVVATTREASLLSYRLFAARDPRALIGIEPACSGGQRELLALMADRCGGSADPGCGVGHEVVDPERAMAALHGDRAPRAAARVLRRARRRAVGGGMCRSHPRAGSLCRHNDPVRSTHAQPPLPPGSRAGPRGRPGTLRL